MKELTGSDDLTSLRSQGTTQRVEDIELYTEGVHLATTAGMIAGFGAPMIALTSGAISLPDFMEWFFLLVPGSGILGTALIAGGATVLSAKSKLRKELLKATGENKSTREISKMLSLKTKKTVIDADKGSTEQETKAIIHSSFRGLNVEYVVMPTPLGKWDQAVKAVIEVHGLAEASKIKRNMVVSN